MATLTDQSGTVVFKGTGTGFGGALETVTVLVPSAEILASFTTPIVVVPSPGAGRAIVLTSIFGQVTGATAGYDSGANTVGLFASTALWQDLSFFTASATDTAGSTTASIGGPIGPLDGAAVVFKTLVANPTLGDGDLTLTVAFYTVTVA